MSLPRGEKLGPYEILAPLGAGGMGEVYKALDTRLDRAVAIKVLPEHIAKREDLRARFEREARAVASLNHPHICTLHDIGPGYMVMELIEGETLAARIEKGALPLDQALQFAAEIADALDRAHRAGVTHRDVKLQNIMLTRDGVKVLDFGLAKSGPKLGPADETLTAGLTTEGTVMGTPQYMAPEQFEGREADARSDIWAFGAVLYEMVTGRKAFHGKSYSSLVGAILSADPPPMAVKPFTPAWLERLVRRCLSKDPEDRYQSLRDVVLDLRTPPAVPKIEAVAGKWHWAGWAVAAILAGVLGAVWALRPGPKAGKPVRFTVSPAGKDVFSAPPNTSVAVPQFALAPDGSAMVFVAGAAGGKSQLWLRSLADAVARPLAGTENASLPFWSPDSQWIGYFSEKQLRKIPVAGGASQTLVTEMTDAFGGAWGPGNTILFSAGAESISQVLASGGTPAPVTKLDPSIGEVAHRWPHFLPDGRHFLFYARAAREHSGLYVGSLDGTRSQMLFRTDSNAIYVPPGFLLYVEEDTLMARRFDAARLELQGDQFAVEEGVGRTTTSFSAISASATGLLAYSGGVLRPGQLTWFDRRGNPSGTVFPEAEYLDFRLSPNEQRLAFSRADEKTSSPQIWISDLDRGSTSRVTLGSATNVSVLWSPDGGRIVFRSNAEVGTSRFYLRSADGGGQGQWILSPETARAAGIRSIGYAATDWSPDGQTILFTVPSRASGYDVWMLPPSAEGKPTPLLQFPGDQAHGSFSPDGKLVAYSSNESGKFEVYVQTFPLSERKVQVSTAGGFEPRWNRDGREIYYIAPDGKLMAVSVSPGLAFGVPQALFQTQVFAPSVFRTHYVPAGNRQRFLVNALAGGRGPAITVAMHWMTGLRK